MPHARRAGIAVLIALALLSSVLVLAVVQKARDEGAAATRAAAGYTAQGARPSTDSRAVIAVVGDESLDGAAAGVPAAGRWPSLLGARLGVGVVVLSGVGAGYTAAGQGGDTFAQLAERVPAAARVVVFVGGAADAEVVPLAQARAATEAYGAAADRASGAEVIAVGPLFRPAGVSAADIGTIRTAQRSAASIAGVRWVDPIGARWVTGVRDAEDLSASDQQRVATRVAEFLDPSATPSSAVSASPSESPSG